jgi:uncharacterized membrane protein
MADQEPTHGYERLVLFSDAVFAIAATLLVIDLRPPTASSAAYEVALRDYLSDPGPFIATAIGFLVVGSYWASHRRVFELIHDANGALVWANLAFLFFVAVQPFLTAAMAEHSPNETSVLLYTYGQVAAGAAQGALWWVAVHHRELLTEHATAARIRYVSLTLLRAPVVFALSIPVTIFVGPSVGMASWGLMVLLAILMSRLFADLDRPSQAPAADPAPAPAPAPTRRPRGQPGAGGPPGG